jgi:hypothetical protein
VVHSSIEHFVDGQLLEKVRVDHGSVADAVNRARKVVASMRESALFRERVRRAGT